MIEKAITENTAALLELAASNRELAEAINQTNGTVQAEQVVRLGTAEEPAKTEEVKEPEAKEPEAEKSEASEVTADDLRKVAGVLVENENMPGFQKVLKQFKTKNITAFDKEDGDLAAMLSALEAEAGVKLADITD